MDRGRKRATGEHGREDPEKTNVSVLILQRVSLFSNWWAAAEEKMSIGLAGRCVFSFAAAGAPGPPNMADFGTRVVLPVVKDIFRTVLKTVGPHAPLPTDAELLSWSSSTAAQEEVHLYRCLCHAFTKTLAMDMDETFATCLNKNGYWLSVVSFWNALLAQIWPKVLRKDEFSATSRDLRCSSQDSHGLFHGEVSFWRWCIVRRHTEENVAEGQEDAADRHRESVEFSCRFVIEGVMWYHNHTGHSCPSSAHVSAIA